MKEKILNYLNSSTLEDSKKNKWGVHITEDKISIGFNNEPWVLVFNGKNNNMPFKLFNRDKISSKDLTESEFFTYLDILIEMDFLRQKQVKLRKLIIYDDIKEYKRNTILGNILDES
jgi:hypothetical protein